MRPQRVIGRDRLRDEIGPLRFHPLVDMRAVIAVRPAIEGAIPDRGHVVGNEVAAELVALVDRGPQRAAYRLDRQADGIAQAGGEDPMPAGGAVDLPDGGAPFLRGDAVLGGVAVGADGHVEVPPIRGGDDVLGPMVVDGAAGEIDHLHAGYGDLGLPAAVGKAQQRVGVGDVKVVADEGHAEGRIEALEEYRAGLGHAVAIGVAQQGDAVGAGHAGTGTPHHQLRDPALDARGVFGPGRRVGLGYQHVAIGQHEEPARMVECVGKGGDAQARRSGRGGAGGPALGRRDVDGGEQRLVRRRQLRVGTDPGRNRQRRLVAAGGQQRRRDQRNERGERGRAHAGVLVLGAQRPTICSAL